MSQNSKSNAFVEILHHARMVIELLRHPDVNILFKTIPLLALIYWIIPTDLIPVIPFISAMDDLAVIGIAFSLFYVLIPRRVMDEIDARLNGVHISNDPIDNDKIIEGEFVEIEEKTEFN